MARQEDQDRCDYLFKIVIVGDYGVGKSNLMLRFTKDRFDDTLKTTIGVEFGTKSLTFKGKMVKCQIWDTAGQERYRSVVPTLYRGAKGVVIVYDITELSSFENVEQWIKDIQASDDDEDLVIMIIGNKSDLEEEREVTKEQGLDFAKKMNSFFMETSAKDFINVSESFSQLIDVILERQPKQRPLSVDESGFASSSASGGASSSNAGAQANTARDHFVLHQGDRSKDDKIDIRPLAEDKYPSKKKCC